MRKSQDQDTETGREPPKCALAGLVSGKTLGDASVKKWPSGKKSARTNNSDKNEWANGGCAGV